MLLKSQDFLVQSRLRKTFFHPSLSLLLLFKHSINTQAHRTWWVVGWEDTWGLQFTQIFVKVDLLPIDNDSEKKKVAQKV